MMHFRLQAPESDSVTREGPALNRVLSFRMSSQTASERKTALLSRPSRSIIEPERRNGQFVSLQVSANSPRYIFSRKRWNFSPFQISSMLSRRTSPSGPVLIHDGQHGKTPSLPISRDVNGKRH